MDSITEKYLTAIRDAAKTILRDHTDDLATNNYWTCHTMADMCNSIGLYDYIRYTLIEELGDAFVHSQLNMKSYYSAFLHDWCDPKDMQPWHSENLKYWRIVWLNFVINRCDQYLRGVLKP